jgi:ketosteroid isomerase-like protein
MIATTEQTHAVIRRYLDAILAGDLDTIRDSFATDATWWLAGDLPVSGTYAGRDAIVDEFLVDVGGRFDAATRRFTLGEPLVAGATAVVEWRVEALTTHGVPYDNRYCGVFETDGERITAVREYADTKHMAEALFG